ncbi:MAG: hypothetical protein QOG61_1929 [Candidatus Binataceae bacterium]|nr:hypothetical protein [Candidatus Binataceae bacterium]
MPGFIRNTLLPPANAAGALHVRRRSIRDFLGPTPLVLLRHKRRRFDCRVQQGQRERFRAMATMSLRRIVAIEFGM